MVQRFTQKAYLESGCWPNKKFNKLKFETKKGSSSNAFRIEKVLERKSEVILWTYIYFLEDKCGWSNPERAAEIIPEQMLMDPRL